MHAMHARIHCSSHAISTVVAMVTTLLSASRVYQSLPVVARGTSPDVPRPSNSTAANKQDGLSRPTAAPFIKDASDACAVLMSFL